MIRGYMQPWLAEVVFLQFQNETLLENAIKQRSIVSDQLTPVEATIPIRKHLVVMQVESLDNHIFDCQIKMAGMVTPFLRT